MVCLIFILLKSLPMLAYFFFDKQTHTYTREREWGFNTGMAQIPLKNHGHFQCLLKITKFENNMVRISI